MNAVDSRPPEPGEGDGKPVPESGTFIAPSDGRLVTFGPGLHSVLSLREAGLAPFFEKPGPPEQALTADEPAVTETVPHVIGDDRSSIGYQVHIERHHVPVTAVKAVPADPPHPDNPN
jgi:hypothetical protein